MRGRKCRRCDAEIMFIETDDGKPMPVEVHEVTIITAAGVIHRGYVCHWAACPGADKERKQQRLF